MFTDENRRDLEEKGFTVVPGVLTEAEADEYRKQFQDWIRDNFDEGSFPDTFKSLVHRYRVGHFAPSWSARLKCTPVFAQLWGTDRLMTSVDTVAIGRPPEEGVEEFCSEETRWLHVDQNPRRQGLHAVQGAVYLETADEDDWTLEVLEGSNKLYDEFWKAHPFQNNDFITTGKPTHRLTPSQIQWYLSKGCVIKRIPVPKGGLVLWDARTIHANANPIKGRTHPKRWRWMVIVCMGPANWASPNDLEQKRKVYEELLLTHHWPAQNIVIFEDKPAATRPKQELTEQPEVARSLEARRLAGVEPYPPLKEGEKVVPLPKWHPDYQPH
ncbi:uncharacterized protein [Littorina saxatilis]|uniref:Phytanoyl-CoA dioxygenase n=1 Tax=Littorina saxatilis TaxID=31220 RepID=A0AAN9GDD8_9CAEN